VAAAVTLVVADAADSLAIACRISRRWPTEATPISFRSSPVKPGSTRASTSLSWKAQ
jgi:hypothetical protein